ncbi:MAG: tetratricopeptide repeat protein [Asticcacaulis sp.]
MPNPLVPARPAPLLLFAALMLNGMTVPVHAQPKTETKAEASAKPAAKTDAPRPASAADRELADRLPPLERASFWAREVNIDPMNAEPHLRLAYALRGVGQFEQAAESAQKALMLDPKRVEAMLEVGRNHIARGQAFYGITALELAVETAPKDWRAHSLLGVAYEAVERPEEAMARWQMALTVSPDNPTVLTNMAMLLATQGGLPEAEGLLRKATTRPGSTLQMRLNLALVLGLQGKMQEAEQILRRDQPPETVAVNLRWLREQLPQNAPPDNNGRTWNTLNKASG